MLNAYQSIDKIEFLILTVIIADDTDKSIKKIKGNN